MFPRHPKLAINVLQNFLLISAIKHWHCRHDSDIKRCTARRSCCAVGCGASVDAPYGRPTCRGSGVAGIFKQVSAGAHLLLRPPKNPFAALAARSIPPCRPLRPLLTACDASWDPAPFNNQQFGGGTVFHKDMDEHREESACGYNSQHTLQHLRGIMPLSIF